MCFQRSLTYFLLTVLGLLGTGCVTPQGVKESSAAQLQLLDTLDAATVSLQQGIDGYTTEKRDLIQTEARILVARMAIYSALEQQGHDQTVNFDTVFRKSNNEIRPYVDHTMEAASDIQPQLDLLQRKIEKAATSEEKNVLRTDFDDLRQRQALLANKPKFVLAMEQIIRADLNDLESTQREIHAAIEVLRNHVAVMKTLAGTVDRWLQVDVTVTTAQVDTLSKTYSDLIKQLDSNAHNAPSGGSHQ